MNYNKVLKEKKRRIGLKYYLTRLIFISFMFVGLISQNVYADEMSTSLTSKPPTELTNPIGISDPNIFIGKIINSALGVVGSIALAMIIYGGFTWMMSAGNKDEVKKGRETITWASLGLILIFTAYAIVNFLLTNVLGQT